MSATDVPTGRALHLVDLENVIGDPYARGPGVAETYESVLREGRRRCGDLVVVAVNPWMARELGFVAHTSCQLLVGHGPDGADRQLIGWGEPEWIVTRFDRLVVASGDGIFAGIVRAVRGLGVDVEVLYGRGRVSALLRREGVALVPVPVGADDHDLAA